MVTEKLIHEIGTQLYKQDLPPNKRVYSTRVTFQKSFILNLVLAIRPIKI